MRKRQSPMSEEHNDVVAYVTYYCDPKTGEMLKKDAATPSKSRLGSIKPSLASSTSKGRQISGTRSKMSSGTFDEHLETIWRSFPEEKRAAFAYLSSFHYMMYKSQKDRALEFIKRKNIFSKNYVIVPIVCWNHWRLIICCHLDEDVGSRTRTRCILLLDSAEACAEAIEPEVRKLVYDIYQAEGRPESKDDVYHIPIVIPEVPQQTNDFDCGRFVLFFIKLFMENAPKNFSIDGYPYFLTTDWFKPEHFARFCVELEEEIPKSTQMVDQQAPTRSSQRIPASQQTSQQNSSQKQISKDKELIIIIDSDSD